jgi:hypothetical protein
MHETGAKFFQLPQERKEALGPFRRISGQVVGFRNTGNRQFLEVRLNPQGRVVPDPESDVPGFNAAAVGVYASLMQVGFLILHAGWFSYPSN